MNQGQAEARQIERSAGGVQGLSDQELVAEILRRDRKATAEFVTRYTDHVYGYVKRRLIPRGDLVEDLVQEIFLAAWENLETFRGESSLKTWLLGVARHKVEDHYRRRLREVQIEEDGEDGRDVSVSSGDLEEAIAMRQTGQRTRAVLAQLPETYSLILQWRYWERRPLREIAEQTGKTEKAVERLLARARSQFKKRWNERESPRRR